MNLIKAAWKLLIVNEETDTEEPVMCNNNEFDMNQDTVLETSMEQILNDEVEEMVDCIFPYSEKAVVTDPMVTCKGFTVSLSGNLYENFPFQLMKEESDFVSESGRFHDKQCFMNGYNLFNTGPLNNDINNCCAQLLSKQKLQKYIDNINETQKHLTTATNIYLIFSAK